MLYNISCFVFVIWSLDHIDIGNFLAWRLGIKKGDSNAVQVAVKLSDSDFDRFAPQGSCICISRECVP